MPHSPISPSPRPISHSTKPTLIDIIPSDQGQKMEKDKDKQHLLPLPITPTSPIFQNTTLHQSEDRQNSISSQLQYSPVLSNTKPISFSMKKHSTNPLPTPPTSQNLQNEHDPEKDVGHGCPLLPLDDTNVDQPLFPTTEEHLKSPLSTKAPENDTQPCTKLITKHEIVPELRLPSRFRKTFGRDLFAQLVLEAAGDRSRLQSFADAGYDIMVKVDDPDYKGNIPRMASFKSVWEAACLLVDFDIPTIERRYGRNIAGTIVGCLPNPWGEAFKLAFLNELQYIPSGRPETYQMVRTRYQHITFTTLERTSLVNKRIAQHPAIPRKRSEQATIVANEEKPSVAETTEPDVHSRRKPFKVAHSPVEDASLAVVPKRKRPSTEDDSKSTKKKVRKVQKVQKASSKSHTRQPAGITHKEGDGVSPNFGRHVKSMLNSRSGVKTQKEFFEDGIQLMPQDDSHLAEELAFCKREKLLDEDGEDTYATQKRRMFIGITLLLEHNIRMERKNTQARISGDKIPYKLFQLNKSAVQHYASMDVNVMSRGFEMYQTFADWVPPMFEHINGVEHVSPWYLERYPEASRRALYDELIKWEDEKLVPAFHIAIRE